MRKTTSIESVKCQIRVCLSNTNMSFKYAHPCGNAQCLSALQRALRCLCTTVRKGLRKDVRKGVRKDVRKGVRKGVRK